MPRLLERNPSGGPKPALHPDVAWPGQPWVERLRSMILGISPLKRARSQGPSLHRRYPAQQYYDPVRSRRHRGQSATLRSLPSCQPVSTDYPHHHPSVPCTVPRQIKWVNMSIASHSHGLTVTQAGWHPHLHFRGQLRLHLPYGRWIAQPPKAAFVTRLRPSPLPDSATHPLPVLPTTLAWIPSTGGARLRRDRLVLQSLPRTLEPNFACEPAHEWTLDSQKEGKADNY